MPDQSSSALFAPLQLRDVELKNRLVLSPMCQYSATDGLASDYHVAHLGRFALGGFGTVIAEATAVLPTGRITHGDLGLWSDSQIPGLARIAALLKQLGCTPGIQLGHAGAKSSSQRPWDGGGSLNSADARGEVPWQPDSVDTTPHGAGWSVPAELDATGMTQIVDAFRQAAHRAAEAGFELLEVHAAHGYLLHRFLSARTNRRSDAYGRDRTGRMRFPLAVVAAVRAAWPQHLPLSVRVSAVDGDDAAAGLADTIVFAKELRARGVDVVDCSSGGLLGGSRQQMGFGFQVPYAAAVRSEADMPTMAVGLITDPQQAEDVVLSGAADLVAIGREALLEPNWALKARHLLHPDAVAFSSWPHQAGWWLSARADLLSGL